MARGRPPVRVALALVLSLSASPCVAWAENCTEPGCDPTEMAAWASEVVSLVRGPIDIATPEAGNVTHGDPADIPGAASGVPTEAVSLGDGGSVIVRFANPIYDGPDYDFAVFENAISSGAIAGFLFAELGFVEVSSNGVDFGRFESACDVTQPVPGFGAVDPNDYQGLAGDQAIGSGTGFDLAEFADHPLVSSGALNLLAVSHVRIIDVIGDGSASDSLGWPIYDPYPTAFDTGGFDLEAIGVLHTAPEPASVAQLAAGLLALQWLARHPRSRPRASRAPASLQRSA